MIATLSGTITATTSDSVIITQAGIGFTIFCPHALQLAANQQATLHTYLHWNQEQGPTLFGFQSTLEKDVFLLIISCSGIGPKIALSILQQVDGTQFLHMIHDADITRLSSLNGIGTKKAEQMCVALKHKAPKLLTTHPQLATKTPMGIWNDLQDTLSSLNYSSAEIKQATSILKEQISSEDVSFDQLLRKSLQLLAKK